jgi:hypothetical protein
MYQQFQNDELKVIEKALELSLSVLALIGAPASIKGVKDLLHKLKPMIRTNDIYCNDFETVREQGD